MLVCKSKHKEYYYEHLADKLFLDKWNNVTTDSSDDKVGNQKTACKGSLIQKAHLFTCKSFGTYSCDVVGENESVS